MKDLRRTAGPEAHGTAPPAAPSPRKPRPVLTACLVLLLACSGDDATGDPTQPEPPSDGYPYPTGRITLSHPPVDLDRVVNFHGLGNLDILPEDHGAFLLSPDEWFKEPNVPIYAPADGKVTLIGHNTDPNFAPFPDDYVLEMRVSTTMTLAWAHLPAVAPDLLARAGPIPTGYGAVKEVDLEVKAGWIIGYAGTQPALDFHLTDTSIQSGLLNLDRYPDNWPYAGCYHDYFAEPIRSRLLAVTERQIAPRCGKIDFDVEGRIVGNWFKDDAPAYAFDDHTSHLAIVYGFLDGNRIAIADGFAQRNGEPYWTYWVKGNEPRPETVGVAEGLVKYELMVARPQAPFSTRPPLDETVVGVFLVQMLEPGRIRVERVMGKTADEVAGFSDDARIYLR